jgi:hypothetical protein
MTTSGTIGHIFIFHDDDEPRPTDLPRGEFVRVGAWADDKNHLGRKKHTFRPNEINAIRMRSAYLNRSISQEQFPLTHVWHDLDRGIRISTLRFVVENLPAEAPDPKGKYHPRALSEICTVIWCLECDRHPFRKFADHVLRNWDRRGQWLPEEKAKCFTIIAFVLGLDRDLKAHLEDLVWHSSSRLQLPIEYLRSWVNARRMQILELRIYDFFHDEILELQGLYPNSEPFRNIYNNLRAGSNQSSVGALLRSWSTHVARGGGLIDLSPQRMTDDVLEVLKREIEDEDIQPGENGEPCPTPHDLARNSGQRGGRGGDGMKFIRAVFRALFKAQKEDKGIQAIKEVIEKAEARKKNTFKELRQDEINDLITWRNNEQTRWRAGCLQPPAQPPAQPSAQMNGHPVAPHNNPQ